MLGIAALLRAVGFALWITTPSYAAFAAGFVLWSIRSALRSGTFEALIYDELAAAGAESSYGHTAGRAGTAALLANVSATALAAPMSAIGGYALVGWVSVAVCLVDAMVSASFPQRPRARRADGTVRGYVRALRIGLREALTRPPVRSLLIVLVWLGIGAFDEFQPLIVRGYGTPTAAVPLLLAAQGVVLATASWLAGCWWRASARRLGTAVTAAAGALAAGAMAGTPMGFIGLTAALAVTTFLSVAAGIRLQHTIAENARATVTSVAGLGTECVALTTTIAVGATGSALSIGAAVALLAVPLALLGPISARLLR